MIDLSTSKNSETATLPVIVFQDDLVLRAVEKVLGSLGVAVIHPVSEVAAKPPFALDGMIGLVANADTDVLGKSICELLAAGVGRFLLLDLWPNHNSSLKKLPTETVRLLEKCSAHVSTDVPEIIDAVNATRKSLHLTWLERGQLYRLLEARDVYQRIRQFGHSQDLDVSNLFLAPLRMLVEAEILTPDFPSAEWWDAATHAASKLGEALRIRQTEPDYQSIGKEILTLVTTLPSTGAMAQAAPDDLRRLMLLLTECRELSQGKDQQAEYQQRVLPVVRPLSSESGDRYRILVVDDHAAAWRPVMDVVRRQLAEIGLAARFDFSTDARVICTPDCDSAAFESVISEYDLVLLDRFLPGTSGLEILKNIRQYYGSLPVIMWTTARQLDLTAEAALASGFLFKKTTTCREVSNTIAEWLELGYTHRLFALFNEFFDRNIRSHALRACASGFTTWCLTTLDAFHAIDDNVLRLFTDHGGRHISGLMRYVANLIFPQLLPTRISPLLSADGATREQELCALYLAVLAHEIGMFPISKHENFTQLSASIGRPLRELHAVRGMVILSDPRFQEDGLKEIIAALGMTESDSFVMTVLALITGYHSRKLKLKTFLELGADEKSKLNDLFSKANASVSTIRMADVQSSLLKSKATLQEIAKKNGDVDLILRIQRLCALFRFADALDNDWTRLPTEFILLDPRRSPRDDLENFKRQVTQSIEIVGDSSVTEVRLTFRAIPPLAAHLAKVIDSSDVDSLKAAIRDPWQADNRALVKSVRKKVEHWLLSFWTTLRSYSNYPPANRWVTVLPNESVVELEKIISSGNYLAEEMQKLVAGLTALCVAGEVLEEYEAIEDSGLSENYTLGEVTWATNWSPAPLTLLRGWEVPSCAAVPDYQI